MSDDQEKQEQSPKQEPPVDDSDKKPSKPPIKWPEKPLTKIVLLRFG